MQKEVFKALIIASKDEIASGGDDLAEAVRATSA